MHAPVLLDEVIEILKPEPGQLFIDGTINGGGHAYVILEHLQPTGQLLGIEWDGELFQEALRRRANSPLKESLTLVNGNYADMDQIALTHGFGGVDGILLDLGMSSWHVDLANKGFSFQKDESLDMRYQRVGVIGEPLTAAKIVNKWPEAEIARILHEYGEERYSRSIAAAIVRARHTALIQTTQQLVQIIKSAVPATYRHGHIHCATRTFQALRITVNSELENIRRGIKAALTILNPGGRLAIISFHSLEDRIVKNAFKDSGLQILTPKPITASESEIKNNSRSRSAKLRAIQK